MHVESGSLKDITHECNELRFDYAKQFMMFFQKKGIFLPEIDIFQLFNSTSWNIEVIQEFIDQAQGSFLCLNQIKTKPNRSKESIPKDKDISKACVFCQSTIGLETSKENEKHLSCGHKVCKDCKLLYSQSNDKEGLICLECPVKSCRGSGVLKKGDDQFLTLEELKQKNGKILWRKTQEFSQRRKAEEEESHLCIPQGDFCTCCPLICSFCNKLAHSGSSCSQNETFVCLLGSEQVSVKSNKDCPKCNKPMDQNLISNRTKCSSCLTSFCWMCLNQWEVCQGYQHCPAFEAEALETPCEIEKESTWPKKFKDYAALFSYHQKLSIAAWNRVKEIESNLALSRPLQLISRKDLEKFKKNWIRLWKAHQILGNGFLVCAFIPQETTEKQNFEQLVKMRAKIDFLQFHMQKLVRASDEPFNQKNVNHILLLTRKEAKELQLICAQFVLDTSRFQKYKELKKMPDFDDSFEQSSPVIQTGILENRIKEEDLKYFYRCSRCEEVSETKTESKSCYWHYMDKQWQCPKCTSLNSNYLDECSGCGAVIGQVQCPECTMFIPRGHGACQECAKNIVEPTDWKCSCGAFNQRILDHCKFCQKNPPDVYRLDWDCLSCGFQNYYYFSQCYKCNAPRPPIDHDAIQQKSKTVEVTKKKKKQHDLEGNWFCQCCHKSNTFGQTLCWNCHFEK